MDELKKYLRNQFPLTMVLGGLQLCILIGIWAVLLITGRQEGIELLKDILIPAAAIAILLFLMSLEIRRHRDLSRLLRAADADPVLREKLITDFKNAESLWDGRVMVGENYVFLKRAAVLHRADAAYFYYHAPRNRQPHYTVVLHTNLQRSGFIITFLPSGQYNTSSVRAAVDHANQVLKNGLNPQDSSQAGAA